MPKPPTKKQTLAQLRADLEAKGLLKPKEAPRLDSDRCCVLCEGPLPTHLKRFCSSDCYCYWVDLKVDLQLGRYENRHMHPVPL